MKDFTQKITFYQVCRKPGSDATRPFLGCMGWGLLTTYVVYHTSPIGWGFCTFLLQFFEKICKNLLTLYPN